MSEIKNKLIKIAYENPELRGDLLPLIMKVAEATVHSIGVGVLKRLQEEAWNLSEEQSSFYDSLPKEIKHFEIQSREHGQDTLVDDWMNLIDWGLKHFSRKYQRGELNPIARAAEDAINPKKIGNALSELKGAGIAIPDVLSQWATKYEDWCRRVTLLPQFHFYKKN